MKTAPDPKDIQEFQFKQSNTSQILDAFTTIPKVCSLLAADKRRGLIYAAQNTKILILKPGEDSDPEWKLEFNTSVVISKLMLNCDCSYLAVAPYGPFILIYDAQALMKNSLQLLYDIRITMADADVFVNDLRWNPTMPGMLCTIASDFTIGSFKIKEKKEKAIELKALEKFNHVDAMCAAWSPKGKQIVVGCKNGSIVQFKPDLKAARTIPGPNPYIGEVVSILWISNYQFCAAYLGSEQRINVLIVDAPKGEANAIFTCYEDITYGMTDTEGQGAVPCYYFDHVPEWGLIIAASSNSSEIAVLGSTDGGVNWNQWQLVDSGRAELPLIRTTESYPVGLAIDKSSVRKLPWGADSTLPHPVPILHILATSGQLCSFHMVNLNTNCPPITSPPTEIVAAPLHVQTNLASESLVMNGAITSTPRPKQPENMPERTKPVPTGNIFNKLVEGNNFFTQPSTEQLKPQQQPKPENTTLTDKPDAVWEAQPQTTKPDIKITPRKEDQEIIAQNAVNKKSPQEDDSRYIRAYLEEHHLFEKELRNRLEPQTWDCGTEEERRKLVDTSYLMDQFLQELKETTSSLSSEIAYLKALLLQSFAWVEETKSKNAATNDITSRSCGDNNKISDLQKLYYYTQTQLSQASKILDLEWSDHKSDEKSRMKIPHLEFVYQNLILHNKIIQEEKGKIQDLKTRWKLLARNNNIFGLNQSLSNMSIGSSKASTTPPRNSGVIEARCKAIASKTTSFTQEKQNNLREHLSIPAPRVIKPVNPSPIQHRLEATLSSLASRSDTDVDIKNKAIQEQPILKQTPVSKYQTLEKLEQQSPLASLDSIVARIGTNDTSPASVENKSQIKQTNFDTLLPTAPANKALEKKSTTSVITTVPQGIKTKQDTTTFGQANPPLQSLMKSFPKVDTITFGTSTQKPDETTAQKSAPKEAILKSGKGIAPNITSMKLENNLFGTSSLKDALTSGTPSERVQTVTTTALKFGAAVPTTTKESEVKSTFSFASTTTIPAAVKSPVQNTFASPQSTNAQPFSFALKPSNTTTPFNLKMTPSTATMTMPQIQDALNLNDEKYSYKPTFGTGFQISLEQTAGSGNQVPLNLVSGAPTKETTAPSLTIEKVPPVELKIPSVPISSVHATPVSATSVFGSQIRSPTQSMFGGVISSSPTTSTLTISSTMPVSQTTTTSPIQSFSGFGTSPRTTSTTSTMVVTSSTMSPLQTSLSKPTFSENATNLSAANITITPATTSSTLTFGNVATTSATSVFAKPSSAMSTQFQSTPAVSSTAIAFGKPATSSTTMTFTSPTSSSIFAQGSTASTTATIFSGSSTNSIFGGNAQVSSAGSIFGGNTASNTFASPQKSIFGFNAQNSESTFNSPTNEYPPLFDGSAATASSGSSPGATSVFGAARPPMGAKQSPLGAQPAFGQAPSFNSKPVFGSPASFGSSEPMFLGGFGATAFGASATPSAFGSPPALGGTPAPIDNNMPKVFGSASGSSTFESLASQSGGLSFSSLAQSSTETPKAPVFNAGSSFSTWR